MLPELEPPPVAHHLGGHDARLEGVRAGDDPVGVDAALVGEGVLPDDGLGGDDGDPRAPGDEPGGLDDTPGVDSRGDPVDRFEGHHRLGEVRVPRPLAEAVYRDLDLGGPCLDGGEGVCHREAEVVVAVDVDGAVHLGNDPPDELPVCRRGDDPHRVRDVQDRRPGLDRDLEDLDEVVPVGPRRVHRRVEDVVAALPRIGDHLLAHLEDLLAGLPDRVDPLHVGGRDEDMHHIHPAVQAGVHVGLRHPGEAADHRLEAHPRDGLHCLVLALRGGGKAGLDDMDPDLGELPGYLLLLGEREGDARCLLAIPEGGVENSDLVANLTGGEEDNTPLQSVLAYLYKTPSSYKEIRVKRRPARERYVYLGNFPILKGTYPP